MSRHAKVRRYCLLMDFWGALVTAFIGSAAGAVVGAGIGWRALVKSDARAHQDREDDRALRRGERLDIALSEIVLEIMHVGQQYGDHLLNATTVPSKQVGKPNPARLFGLIQAATLSADADEREVLDRLRKAFRPIELIPIRDGVMNAVTDLVFALTQWRTGDATRADLLAHLDRMIATGAKLDEPNASRAGYPPA